MSDLDLMSIPPGSWADVGEELLFNWKDLIPQLDRLAQKLSRNDFKALYVRWKLMDSPTFAEYGLAWVVMPPDCEHDGVAIINDNKHARKFQIYVDYKNFSAGGRVRLYWQMLACVLAHESGLPKIKSRRNQQHGRSEDVRSGYSPAVAGKDRNLQPTCQSFQQ